MALLIAAKELAVALVLAWVELLPVVTRVLTLGVQSFNVRTLQKLGRKQTPQQVYRAYEQMRAVGFKNINRVEYQPINLATLQGLADKGITTIGIKELIEAGLAKAKMPVKILGNGTLTTKVEVTANAFSKSAEAAIQNVGGTATKL